MGSIRTVFEQCQSSLSVHQKLLTSLKTLYTDTEDKQAFFDEFVRLLRYALVRSDKSVAVMATLEFAARFARFLGSSSSSPSSETADTTAECSRAGDEDYHQQEEDEETGTEVHPFFLHLADFLLDHHWASSSTVRYRCCELLNRLLVSLGEDAYLDDRLWQRLYEAMLQRLQDVSTEVRVQAVQALARLQDPTDRRCPVITAYLFHLRCDPQPDVRRAVLANIGGSAQTLAAVLERVADMSGAVRRQAYRFLTKVHIKSLTIEQRRRVLQAGLNDREPSVVTAVRSELLPAWLRLANNCICQLLRCFNVTRCQQLAEQLLTALLADMAPTDVVEVVAPPDNWCGLEADSWLTDERAILWRVALQHLHTLASSSSVETAVERLSPDLASICHLLEHLTSSSSSSDTGDSPGSFILQQLLQLVTGLELWDEFSRRRVVELVRQMLVVSCRSLPLELVGPLVRVYERLVPDCHSRVAAVVDIIADLRTPQQPQQHQQKDEKEERPQQEEEEGGEKEEGVDDGKLRFRRAQLRMRIMELRDKLDTAVEQQDFSSAQQLQQQLASEQLEQEKLDQQLQQVADSDGRNQSRSVTDPAAVEATDDADDGDGEFELLSDSVTMCRCLELVSQLLQSDQLKGVSDQLRALTDSLIVPAVQSSDVEVRCAAAQALGTMCLLECRLARQYLPLLVQVSRVDESTVQLAAYRAIFDQLLVHGPQRLLAPSAAPANMLSSLDETEGANNNESVEEQTTELMTQMAALVNSQDLEIRGLGAEALCKLLIHGRVSSARLIERLVLLWYSPLSDGHAFLRNMLGVFFPAFAAASRDNQELLAEAMLPTLNTLLQAPLASPLIEVDVDDVARFFVQLTRTSMLNPSSAAGATGQKSATVALCVHETLAFRLLHALRDEARFRLDSARRSLSRALAQLQLVDVSVASLHHLRQLCRQLCGHNSLVGEDKLVLKQLDKFATGVEQLLTAAEGCHSEEQVCGDKRIASLPFDQSPPSSRRLLDSSVRRSGDISHVLVEPAGGGELVLSTAAKNTSFQLQSPSGDSDEFTSCVATTETAKSRRSSHLPAIEETKKRSACTPPQHQHKLSRSRAPPVVSEVVEESSDQSPELSTSRAPSTRTRNTRRTAKLSARRTKLASGGSPDGASDSTSVISATSSEAGSTTSRSTRSTRSRKR